MIDKKIFYCWFGDNEKTELQKACIRSWREMCPDYQIIEINENNFDVESNEYSREAYKNNNYSFVSDVVRLEVLSKESGFYLDTDIRLLKSLDELRKYKAFFCSNGKGYYNSAPLGCETFIDILKNTYKRLKIGDIILPILNKEIHNRYDVLGLDYQEFDNIAFLGAEYFITPDYSATEKTIGIHYCVGSWLDKWKGGFNKKANFNGFEVYQDGFRDLTCENRHFKGCEKIGKFYTFNSPFKEQYKFFGNYFYNNRVMRVIGNNLIIERYNAEPTSETYTTEGMVLECR